MSGGIEELGSEAFGAGGGRRWEAAARGRLDACLRREPAWAPWLVPLGDAITRRSLEMPSLTPTRHRVIQLVGESEVEIDALAEAVSADPTLAARVMGVANSAFFRGVGEISSVRDALVRMGLREARTIIVVAALRTTMLRAPGLGEAATGFWEHSLRAATATHEIAQELPPWQASGFLAGLVHGLGRVLWLSFLDRWSEGASGASMPPPELRATIGEAIHAPLGAMALATWHFPDEFCAAIATQDDPPAEAGDASALLARAIALGSAVAWQLASGWPESEDEIDEALLCHARALGLDFDGLSDRVIDAEASFEALSKLS